MDCVRNCFWVGRGLATDLMDTTSYCMGKASQLAGKVTSLGERIVRSLASFTNEEDPPEMNALIKTAKSIARFVVEMFLIVGGVFALFASIPAICFCCCILKSAEIPSDEVIAKNKERDKIASLAFTPIKKNEKCRYLDKIDLANSTLKKDLFWVTLGFWAPSELMTGGLSPSVEELEVAVQDLPAAQGEFSTVDEKTFLAARKMMHGMQKGALKAVIGRASRFSLFTIPHKKEVIAFCKEKLKDLNPKPETVEDCKVLYTWEDLTRLRLTLAK